MVDRRIPTDAQLRAKLDILDGLHRKPRDKALAAVDRTQLDSIARRLARAVSRDRGAGTERDGFPSSTLGSGGAATPGLGSTTETAALGRPARDRHHELTARACEQVDTAVVAINALVATLESIDDLTSDRGPAPRTCEACTGHRPLGGDQAVAHRGTVGDRLERPVDLCISCYRFVEYTTRPGTRLGLLPTPEQIRQHDQRGRWRLRTGAA